MIVNFSPQRALFSTIFFANCFIFLFLFKKLNLSHSRIFGKPGHHSIINTNATWADGKVDYECAVVDQLNKDGIVIVIKTGAQEISNLLIHFSTTLRCFEPEDILLFSDLEETLGQFHVHDALRNVDEKMKNEHGDFEIYRTIHHYNATGQDINQLKEDQKLGESRKGWTLDKYKFLHIVEETYEMRPDANWYVFIETDTYMFWPNLIKWLERWDASVPLYMGSPTRIGNAGIFAHGGSGYAISKAAMNNLLADDQDQHLSAMWDARIQEWCCGDFGIGKSLEESGTEMTFSWPMCNGERPSTVPFGREYWCQPVVTLHHAGPEDISNIWRFQRQREDQERNLSPILYKDIHDSDLLPQFPRTRDNWDNMSVGRRLRPPPYELEPESESESQSDSEPQTESEDHPDTGSSDHDPSLDALHGDVESTTSSDHDPSLNALHGDTKPETESTTQSEHDPSLNALHGDTKPELKNKNAKLNRPPNPNKHPLPKTSSKSKRGSKNPVEEAHKSFEHCAKACEAEKYCFQYSFQDDTKRKGKQAGMGECRFGDKETWVWGVWKEGVRSGWLVDRIGEWTGKEENQCREIAWID